MKPSWKSALALFCSVLLLVSSAPAFADSIFDFSNNSDFTQLPLTLTNNGLTATFTGHASVCVTDDPEVLFATLHGPAVMQNFCTPFDNEGGTLGMSFSQNLSSLTFDFATASVPATLTVNLFEDGVLVGTDRFNSAYPPVYVAGNAEGVADITGTFNSILFTTAPTLLAYDNVDAVVAPEATPIPEPSTLAECLTGATLFVALVRRARPFAQRT